MLTNKLKIRQNVLADNIFNIQTYACGFGRFKREKVKFLSHRGFCSPGGMEQYSETLCAFVFHHCNIFILARFDHMTFGPDNFPILHVHSMSRRGLYDIDVNEYMIMNLQSAMLNMEL